MIKFVPGYGYADAIYASELEPGMFQVSPVYGRREILRVDRRNGRIIVVYRIGGGSIFKPGTSVAVKIPINGDWPTNRPISA